MVAADLPDNLTHFIFDFDYEVNEEINLDHLPHKLQLLWVQGIFNNKLL